jgi:tetratricopeptide (TPR) repeat protein
VGLADILRKCVAPEPSARYDSAAALADDLRRHLNDLPLRGVANRSPVERWQKWRRRHPAALAWVVAVCSILLVSTVAIGVLVAAGRERLGLLEDALKDGRRFREIGQYDEAIRSLKRGLESADGVPAAGRLAREMDKEIVRAQRGQIAEELHDLADLVRFQYGMKLPSEAEARTLVQHCRTIWGQRDHLLNVASERGAEASREVKTDLVELAAVWADLRIRFAASADQEKAQREVLTVLDEARASCGPSLAIDLRREPLARALGRSAPSASPPRIPQTAWEHYDRARYYLRSGRIEPAAVEFQRTLDERPQDVWSNFYQGLCAYRLHHYEDAVAAFRSCIALQTNSAQRNSAIAYYNRALAYDALGRPDEAYRDYTRALEHDPKLGTALLNRGILSYKRGRHGAAIEDFQRASSMQVDDETLGRLHHNLALAQLAQGDRAAALLSGKRALSLGCQEAAPLVNALR